MKDLTNILLSILIVVVLGVAGYFIFKSKTDKTPSDTEGADKKDKDKPALEKTDKDKSNPDNPLITFFKEQYSIDFYEKNTII